MLKIHLILCKDRDARARLLQFLYYSNDLYGKEIFENDSIILRFDDGEHKMSYRRRREHKTKNRLPEI